MGFVFRPPVASGSKILAQSFRDDLVRGPLDMVAPNEPQQLLVEPVRDENFDMSVRLDYIANDPCVHVLPLARPP